MPRVPGYDNFQVGDTALPQAQFRQVNQVQAADVPNVAGQDSMAIGKGLMQAGDAAGRIALDMQQQANQLRVDDAVNKAKEAALKLTYDKDVGFTNLKGVSALERPGGKPLADEYADNLRGQMSEIASSLGNEQQRIAFGQHSNNLLTQLQGQAMKHESDQFREYALSVREGTISTRMNEIGLNYNNPQVIDEAITSIKAATYDQGRLLGKSAEWIEAQTRKMTSNAHKVALGTAIEQNDIAFASDYLKKYSKDMDADDILRARGLITKEMDQRLAVTVATDVMRGTAPKIANTDADRAFNIALGTESGNRQFGVDGKPLTSKAGAIGIAQVMPGTAPEAAKMAGLPWDEDRYKNDAKYNEALGRAYFQKQVQDFGGDLSLAYAAYNAGPGRVKQALNQKAKWDKENPGQEGNMPWTEFLPEETQNYVLKNMRQYESGGGAFKKPTIQDVHASVREKLGPDAKPAVLRVALDEATKQYDDMNKAIKQRGDDAVATAMQEVQRNGGRYSDLPVAIRAAIPPQDVDNVMSFAQKIAKGDDVTSPWLYNKLTSNPDTLASMSDSEFYKLRRELSDSDFKHFSEMRAKVQGKTPGSANGPGELNTSAIKSGLDSRLRQLGLDPTPKDTDLDASGRVGAIRQFVDQYFVNAQRDSGKKFSDAEVSLHLDNLFSKNMKQGDRFWGLVSGSSGPMLGMKAGDIPGATRDAIKAAYKNNGVDSPTDAQILHTYFNLQTANK